MSKPRIKAVLFDLGETLLNFGKVNTMALFRQGAKSSHDFLESTGQATGNFEWYFWRNLLVLYCRRLFSKITGKDFDCLRLLKTVGTKKGIKLSEQQWEHLEWLWYEPLSIVGRAEMDIKNTLTALQDLGLKLGIVSNTFINKRSLEKHLEKWGILKFFSVRLYSYEFSFRKPDIRIFKIAAEQIGETSEDILFVGDRVDKDIKPAIKFGMTAVLKTAYTNLGSKLPKESLRVDLLSELPELIKKINSDK